ncbi:tetratricopeptide repeat protein [Wenyingzhuangia sp. IMCC45533]
MNKILLVALSTVISFSGIAQKKELKSIEKKLINSGKKQEANAALKEIDATAKGTEYESYLFYLYGRNAFGDKKNADYITAAEFFKKAIKSEQEKGQDDYTKKSIEYLNNIHNFYFGRISQAVKKKNYNQSGGFYDLYSKAFPERRDLLILSLFNYQQAKSEDKMIGVLEKLLKLDRNNISYAATDKRTKRVDEYFDKESRDLMVEIKTHHKPEEIKIDAKTRVEYYNNLVRIYNNKGSNKKTLSTLDRARKEFPENVKFMNDYATVIYKTGDKKGFVKALQDVAKLDPNNKNTWLNLGITHQELNNTEEAILAYDKVIELDPNYRGAYVNKGLAIMSKEASIIQELNQNLNNRKNYDAIKKKLDAMYQKAIPTFEKAYELEKTDGIKATLINLYNSLGQKDKASAIQ